MLLNNLPQPTPEAQIQSQQLLAKIVTKIETQGPITFADFMHEALYAPQYGYYRNGLQKLGADGDFITGPELSPLYSQCIAKQCHEVLNTLKDGSILEFGPGSGIMAAEIIKELARLNTLPKHYYLIELSAELKERQKNYLQQHVPEFFSLFHWLDHFPTEPISGVILANEVIDAMPVHKFGWQNHHLYEYWVDFQQGSLCWKLAPPSSIELTHAINALNLPVMNGYHSEINLQQTAWIASLAEILTTGIILIIDYGFPRHEYYHSDRDQGTLMCHYQHYAHTDPLVLVGLQDITAHVDFTSIADVAYSHGLAVSGFTHQAGFLMNCGIEEFITRTTSDIFTSYTQAQQLKRLMLPSEMGELFKVIALTKYFDHPLLGFKNFNQLTRLGSVSN